MKDARLKEVCLASIGYILSVLVFTGYVVWRAEGMYGQEENFSIELYKRMFRKNDIVDGNKLSSLSKLSAYQLIIRAVSCRKQTWHLCQINE